jgi:hypothetical protein
VYLLTQDDNGTPDPVETILLPAFGLGHFIRARIGSALEDAQTSADLDEGAE